MSHFTVLVIWEDIESSLAPFQENNMGNCPDEYLEFETEITKEEFKEMSQEEKEETENDYEEKDWAYWYMSNPNSKWDWFQIWGRWAWMFLLKESVEKSKYPLANFSWGWDLKDKEEVQKAWKVDSAEIQDIDFEWMKKEVYDKSFKHFSDILEKFDEIPKLKKTLAEFQNDDSYWEDYEKRRADYHNQRALKVWSQILEDDRQIKEWRLFSYFASLENYQFESAEKYAEKQANEFFSTYAVLTEEWEWESAWEMGWFWMSSETSEEKEEFVKWYFDTFLKDLAPETILTIVDCHV